ncbi:conserved hypothetical protein, partial [sediment metagenome]
MIRDIPEESIVAGNKITNLRQDIKRAMQESKISCRCIRCREVGHQDKIQKSKIKNQKYKFKNQKYKVLDGIEYFLSFESQDEKILYAFCRLHI